MVTKKHYRVHVEVIEVVHVDEEKDRYDKVTVKGERRVLELHKFSLLGDSLDPLIDKTIAHLELAKKG